MNQPTFVCGLRCLRCGRSQAWGEGEYTCPVCGGNRDVLYDYAAIARFWTRADLRQNPDRTIRRWLPLLPLHSVDSLPPLAVGDTPLYRAERLERRLGLAGLWLKDDGRNPTASFKDRASAVVVAYAREAGHAVITTASSGNAGAALAGCAAAVEMPAVIFVPETAPRPKVAQLLTFGARVFTVRGSYDQAFDLCLEASARYGWYNRSTGINPITREGKKTCAYEIAEAFRWQSPDKVFVAVGDGNILSGLGKGFRDLVALGWLDRLPALIGVQAEGASPLVRAWGKGTEEIVPVEATTVADSISVGLPRDGLAALQAVRESGGRLVAVSDAEILAAIPRLAREAGVFAEPAGATAFAGLLRLVREGGISATERIVVVITGNGLKDVAAAMRVSGEPETIEPSLSSLSHALNLRPL